MIKLILSGGGGAKESEKLDRLLLTLIPKGKKLLYIPIAMPESVHPFPECFKWLKSVFNPLRFNGIVMWTDLNRKTLQNLKEFGAVYIGGGNTFRLLYDLRRTGFDKTLIKFIQKGGVVYGGSAGAIIFGKDIMTSAHEDKNEVGLKDTSGFDFIKGFSIWAHYKGEHDIEVFEYIKKYKIPVIALPEGAGLFVKNSKIRVLGFKSTVLFEKEKKTVIPLNSFL